MMYTEVTKSYILNVTFCNFVNDKANIKQANNKVTSSIFLYNTSVRVIVQHINPRSNVLQHCPFPSEIIKYKAVMLGFWCP